MEGKEVFIDVSISFLQFRAMERSKIISMLCELISLKMQLFTGVERRSYFITDTTFEVIFLNF